MFIPIEAAESKIKRGNKIMNNYDSEKDTRKHKEMVAYCISILTSKLDYRAGVHDNSKLESPEKELFDEYTPKLKDCTYGSDEYKEFLKGLNIALEHHYKENSHHPEHYENGIDGMDLIDLVEMICDWMSASKRHADGNIYNSLKINKKRFNMSEQLVNILKNTVDRYFQEVIDMKYE